MLTKKMQIQALADRLAGLPAAFSPRNLTDPWRTCWLALDRACDKNPRQAIMTAIHDLPDRDAILGAIYSTQPGTPLGHYPTLQQMHDDGLLPPIEWLWPNWLPLRMLSILAGEPGVGKSMIALDVAGRIVAGRHFPDGSPVPCTGATVIYVDAEDAPSVHDERSLAWQLDRTRLYLMLPGPDQLFIDLNEPTTRDRLIEMMHTLTPALVIIDSLSSISLKGESAKEDVMILLAFLKRAAQEFNCAVLLIHHLRKPPPGLQARLLTMADVRGSGHIVAAARSVLGASVVQTGPQPDKNGPRRLEVLKTNLTRYPKPLGINLTPGVDPKWVYLEYGDPPERYQEPTKTDLCADFILSILEEHGEPMKPKEIIELALKDGYSRPAVYRAREGLSDQIINTAGRRDPNNRWALAGWETEEKEEK